MQQYTRYLIIAFTLTLVFACAVSYLLDPLGYFRTNGLRSKSFLGERVWGHDRTAKALALSGLRPDTLLLGTSRVKQGFDIDDPEIQKYIGNAYNLALSAATMDEMDRFIRYALIFHTPSNIIIGLDFSQFETVQSRVTPAFMDNDASALGRIVGMLQRIGFALWSKNALISAAEMSFKKHSNYLNGSRNLDHKERKLQRIGVRAQSLAFERSIASRLKHGSDMTYKGSLDTLDLVADYACSKNIHIRLFISPLHIRQLLLLKTLGLQENFFSWKRDLTDITEKHRRYGCGIDLVDFSRISEYTTEPLPAIDDLKTSPHWYWESSHYKAALGKLVIRRLWDRKHAIHDFGISLNSEGIDHEIQASRDELIQYQNTHPELVKEMHDTVLPPHR